MALIGLSRDDIRDDTVARIIAASTAAGSRVYVSRTRRTTASELPLVLVYVHTADDTVRGWSGAPGAATPIYERRTRIVCECQAAATVQGATPQTGAAADDDLQAALDLSDDVLDALVGSTAWLTGSARTSVRADRRGFESIESIEHEIRIGGDADERYGAVRVTLTAVHEVQYDGA